MKAVVTTADMADLKQGLAPCLADRARRIASLGQRMRRDKDGVAAVEFALLLPLMLAMYMGCVELSSGYSCLRKVDGLARALSDLSSQAPSTIDAAAMAEIVASAKGVLQPFDTTVARIAISSILVPNPVPANAPLKAYMDWSYTNNGGTARPCGLQANGAVPGGYMNAGRSAIVADVGYDYKPLLAGPFQSFGNKAVGQITLNKTMWLQPRILARVPISGVAGQCAGVPAFP